MARRSRSFIPDASNRLEDRVVLTHGPVFSNGAALLTSHALHKTQSEIQHAFVKFATHGQKAQQLKTDLTSAVSRIPFHKGDGVDDDMSSIVDQMQSDISGGVATPVKTALGTALSDLKADVQSRISDGGVVYR